MSTKQSNHRAIADAVREATAAATQRAVAIVNAAAVHGRPLQEATTLITSGKTVAECEAELRRAANTASWNKAIGETGQQQARGAVAASWDAAVDRANGG